MLVAHFELVSCHVYQYAAGADRPRADRCEQGHTTYNVAGHARTHCGHCRRNTRWTQLRGCEASQAEEQWRFKGCALLGFVSCQGAVEQPGWSLRAHLLVVDAALRLSRVVLAVLVHTLLQGKRTDKAAQAAFSRKQGAPCRWQRSKRVQLIWQQIHTIARIRKLIFTTSCNAFPGHIPLPNIPLSRWPI
jgi:hypothetical protein